MTVCNAHNMKSQYQCPKIDLHFRLCFLRKKVDMIKPQSIWMDVYNTRQFTEIGLEKPLISTFAT